jgi:hypothetical protein
VSSATPSVRYSEVVVRLLLHLRDCDGRYSQSMEATPENLAVLLSDTTSKLSPRYVRLAMDDLRVHGLVKGRPITSDASGPDAVAYMMLDITGSGLALLESIETQAVNSGAKRPWDWQPVHVAASVTQIVTFVAQAVAVSVGR